MKILIDNGHGLNTSGKRSPDGTFREAIYNREIARRIVLNLVDRAPWGLIRNVELLRLLEKRLEDRQTWQGRCEKTLQGL